MLETSTHPKTILALLTTDQPYAIRKCGVVHHETRLTLLTRPTVYQELKGGAIPCHCRGSVTAEEDPVTHSKKREHGIELHGVEYRD